MTQYIDKSALVAEIDRRIKEISKEFQESKNIQYTLLGKINALENLLPFLNTLEVKEANEALRTEYEKGRADVIADTLSWLDNCWPKYCSNQTIIEGFKEAIKD